MRFRLIPREEKFFEDFTNLADRIVSGAELLEQMLAQTPPAWETAAHIKQVEHDCDVLTNQVIQRLNRTFVTPIDREDIHALATSLDDVMDAIDASAAIVRRYRLESVPFGGRELAAIITGAMRQVRNAVGVLERRNGIHEMLDEVKQYEDRADQVHDEALRRLFEQERDPITVLKWKEMLDHLEEAADCCEDVANVVEGVAVKHG